MAILPGWGSLAIVTTIRRWAEISGVVFLGLVAWADYVGTSSFVFLGLLVLAETVRIVYDRRKDKLVAEAQAPRILTATQKQLLVHALSPFRGQPVEVVCVRGDGEGQRFAENFVAVFVEAGWDLGHTPGVDQLLYSRDPIGVRVLVNQAEPSAGLVLQAASALRAALVTLGVPDIEQEVLDPSPPVGHIMVRIGRRPPRENADAQEDNGNSK